MSLKAFFNAPVRHLKDLVTVESALEKPYRWDYDYPAMHIEFPPFPDWELGPWQPWHPWDDGPQSPTEPNVPLGEGPQPEPCLGCAIVCRAPYPECEDDPIWCHAGIWCGNDLHCWSCSWEVRDGLAFVKNTSPPAGKNFYVYIDTEKLEDETESGEATFFICMTDPLGHVCCDEVEIECETCNCDTEPDVSWITTDGEVPRGGSLTIYAQDGCPPYNWGIVGDGFSLDSATTDEPQNTVNLADDTCAENHNDASCTVTLTDSCGDSAGDLVLRNGDGEWTLVGGATCIIVDGVYCSYNTNDSHFVVSGADRWYLSGIGDKCTKEYTSSSWTNIVSTWKDPPYGACTNYSFGDCDDGGSCEGELYYINASYYIIGCP